MSPQMKAFLGLAGAVWIFGATVFVHFIVKYW